VRFGWFLKHFQTLILVGVLEQVFKMLMAYFEILLE
jgi:hypothetical protein